jgi:hypothetical protein
LAPSSNAHTYRLLIFKELYSVLLHLPLASNRFVRQQQRKEIMQCFSMFVNFFFDIPQNQAALVLPQLFDFVVVFMRGRITASQIRLWQGPR